jgi:hypothetical protein
MQHDHFPPPKGQLGANTYGLFEPGLFQCGLERSALSDHPGKSEER